MIPKLEKYRNHLQNLSWYLGSTLLVALISVAINPLLAKNLSPDDYAVIGYYSSFNILLTPFITFFLSNYFIRQFYAVDEQQRARLKSTILYMLLLFSLVLSAVSLIGMYIYQTIFNIESKITFMPYAFLTIFAIQFSGIYSLTLAELRIKRQPKKFALFSIVAGVTLTSISLLLVVLIKGGAAGRLSATLITNIIMFGVVLLFQKDSFKCGFDKRIFKNTIIFCWPLVIAACLEFTCGGFDKMLLERLGDLSELGYYSVGAQIAGYLSIFSTSINSTFQPDIYEGYAKKNYKRVALFVGIIIGITSFVVIVFVLLAPFVVDILTAGRYTYSTNYSVIIAFTTVTSTIYYASSNVTMAMGYTKLLLLVKVIASCLSVVLYIFLINGWTYKGAAWGNVSSYLILFIVNVTLVFFYMKYRKHKENAMLNNG